MSESEILGENPAEPVPDVSTAAEAGQPVEPDEVPEGEGTSSSENDQILEFNPEPNLQGNEESVEFSENIDGGSIPIAEKAPVPTIESLQEITKALDFYEPSRQESLIPFSETLRNEEPVAKKFFDKFTQTFYKYMKNLSDRRFIEIIKQEIDHEDQSLVFYCSENALALTFQ